MMERICSTELSLCRSDPFFCRAPQYDAPSKLARFPFKRVAWISPNVRAWTNTAHNLDI
jgi:hypothetical protein